MINRMVLKDTVSHVAIVLASMLVLCFWAFYNQYPLYFSSDTAMYLEAAFRRSVGPDRPVMYGLFMYYVSLQHTLWLVVFVQALITAYVLYLYFRYFTSTSGYKIFYVAFIVLVTFCTGASFNVSWLLADIFTSVSVLCFGLLLFVKRLRRVDIILVSLLMVLGVAMHNSHFFICMGILVVVFSGYFFKGIRKQFKSADIKMSRLFYVLALLLLSNLITASVHYAFGAGFRSSRGGEIFLMGNMVEMGVINSYLAENCDERDYQICHYRDTLPNNFVWASNSPVYAMGGWDGSKDEFKAIITDVVTTPRYLKDFAFKSAIYTLKQLFHFDTGEATLATKRIEYAFRSFYPNEYEQFDRSKQRNGELDFSLVNFVQTIVVGFALMFFIWALFESKTAPKLRMFMLFLLVALLVNAIICAVFSGVYFRYQARVVWVVPLPLFLHALANWKYLHKYLIQRKIQL